MKIKTTLYSGLCVLIFLAAAVGCGSAPKNANIPSDSSASVATVPEDDDASADVSENSDASANVPEINGVSLADFSLLVLGDGSFKKVAKDLNGKLSEMYGVSLALLESEDDAYETEHRIVVGWTDPSRTCGVNDAAVFWRDGSIFISAGGSMAMSLAKDWLLYSALGGDGEKAVTFPEDGSDAWSLVWPEREEYISDPTAMPLFWQYIWEPDEQALSWESKVDSLCGRDQNHIFTIAHRGDYTYYPENSIEGIISAWAMGADCVEMDVRFTKDGVPVLMHDDTLTRTTNVISLIGKENLPFSFKISDWTYEELQKLNLVMGKEETPYKIPTLEEALRVCKERAFVLLDKPEVWRYSDVQDVTGKTTEYTLLPTMIAADNASSVLLCCGLNSAEEALAVQKQVSEETGEDIYFYLATNFDPENIEKLLQNSVTNASITVCAHYHLLSDEQKAAIKALCDQYPDVLIGVWNVATPNAVMEIVWQDAWNLGVRSMWSDTDLIGLLKFENEHAQE